MARLATGRPVLTIGVVLALALGGALLALGLKPSAGTGSFVSSSSASYRATAEDQRDFGDDAVVILIQEPLRDLVETKDLATETQLEACLAGQYVVANQTLRALTPVPIGTRAPHGGWASPCGMLMKTHPVQVVYGPGTFLNRAVSAVNGQIQGMLAGAQHSITTAGQDAYELAIGKGLGAKRAATAASAAGRVELQQVYQALEQNYLNSGISGTPAIDDAQFVRQIVFDKTRGVNQPKARFAYMFPTKDSALIQVKLKASLSDEQQAQAISWIRQAIRMPIFRSAYGARYTVSGVPVVINDLASEISGSIAGLLVVALAVMAATLLIMFRSPWAAPESSGWAGGESSGWAGGESSGWAGGESSDWASGASFRCLRLLPLAIALAAAGISFGLLALLGAPLTMASIAVLPILIGIAVDYGIQFQARAEEASASGASAGRGPLCARDAVVRAAGVGAPTVATAALATVTGFLVLLLSPIPMVRGFGLLLVLGIAVALVCALTAGSAALALSDRDGGLVGASLRGAGEIFDDLHRWACGPERSSTARSRPGRRAVVGSAPRGGGVPASLIATVISRPGRGGPTVIGRGGRVIATVIRRPGRVIAIAAALAVLGWIADTQTSVQSDVTKLVPSNMRALQNLRTLERITGVSGEIDVTVRGHDVATPRTVEWMIGYENSLLEHFGYLEERGCAHATLCPALSLPDLFSAGPPSGRPTRLSQNAISGLLASVPTYFSRAVITPDRRQATLAFGIRLMPLSRQEGVIQYMRSRLHPPPGVEAQLAGLPVLAAQADAALSSSGRRLLTLVVGLLAVFLTLLAVLRRPKRAFLPMIPIALATGWSALILFLIGIPLNPMSATLGALVIAISTEFSVLLSERFRQEQAAGHDLTQALGRTYRSTGAAVLASGITAIAGFGVLIFSSITMLRDFGFVTVVDLSVSLGGVLLVLPAALALSERGDALARATGVLSGPAGPRARLRRRPRVA
jgi:hydrophobe/amphiphile efflux-3 (HAE3) family protein